MGFGARLGKKRLHLAQNCEDWEGTFCLGAHAGTATVRCGLKPQIWEGRAKDGQSGVQPKLLAWSNGRNGKETCCLLARFKGRGVCSTRASLPGPNAHQCWGLGVSLDHSEGWKPQKVEGCWWTTCPLNCILSHVAREMAESLLRASAGQNIPFLGHWGRLWALRGHVPQEQGEPPFFLYRESKLVW